MLFALAILPGLVSVIMFASIGGLVWQDPGSVSIAPGVYLAELSVAFASATISVGLLVMGRRVQ